MWPLVWNPGNNLEEDRTDFKRYPPHVSRRLGYVDAIVVQRVRRHGEQLRGELDRVAELVLGLLRFARLLRERGAVELRLVLAGSFFWGFRKAFRARETTHTSFGRNGLDRWSETWLCGERGVGGAGGSGVWRGSPAWTWGGR